MQQTLQVFIIRKWLRQPRLANGVGELRTHKDRLLYAKDRKSGCNFLVETGVEVSVFATLYSTPLYYSYHSATSKQSTNQGTRSCSWILHSHLRPPTFRALFRQPPFSVDFCNCLYLPTTIVVGRSYISLSQSALYKADCMIAHVMTKYFEAKFKIKELMSKVNKSV